MRERVKAFIDEYGMIEPEMKITAGISGGADSVCLLFLLREICADKGAKLTAVHVNHGLRGAESDGDEAFVSGICEELGVPLKIYHFDVRERARREGLSLEEAGRMCRYEAFRESAGDGTASRIAVAHHRDDQAETVLFKLFRGSGIRGLCGMQPAKDDIIRPLLCVGRAEILDFLENEGIPYRTDSSNDSPDYARNRIRNEILKTAKDINSRASEHTAMAAEELSGIERFLENETCRAYDACVSEKPDGLFISEGEITALDPVIRSRVLRKCMYETGGLKDVTRGHILALEGLISMQTGRRIDLPDGRRAWKDYDGVRIQRPGAAADGRRTPECGSFQPDLGELPASIPIDGRVWTFSIEEASGKEIIPQKRYTKWFDCDRIVQTLTVRRRRPGDFLEINDEHGKKKLKSYFVDEKVPAEERDGLWLLASGSHIMWVPGYRISAGFKVTKETKKILKVQIVGGEEDG